MGCHCPCCEVNENEEVMQKLITDDAKYVALLNVEPPATLFMNLPMSMMVHCTKMVVSTVLVNSSLKITVLHDKYFIESCTNCTCSGRPKNE